jgi:serine palmitoyltransferase
MPSPIAINPPSLSQSIFKKMSKSPSNLPASAASYLSAVSQADANARARTLANVVSPTSTPALSVSSSVTASSEDSVLREGEPKMYHNDDGLSYPRIPPTSEQVFNTVHSEFGHCANEEYRFTSQHPVGKPVPHHEERDPPYYILLSTYISYMILICLGQLRDFIGKRLRPAAYTHLQPHNVRRYSRTSYLEPYLCHGWS